MSETSQPAEKVPEIRIISRGPEGFRRGGIAHPADKTYPATEFSAEQIIAFQGEPLLTVIMDPELAAAAEAAARRRKK